MRSRIGILAWGSLSPLGDQPKEIWDKYLDPKIALTRAEGSETWVGSLSAQVESTIDTLKAIGKPYTKLDRTVLLALLAAEKAMSSFEGNRQGRCVSITGNDR